MKLTLKGLLIGAAGLAAGFALAALSGDPLLAHGAQPG